MDFKYIDKKYRPIPFWSWNEKLDTEQTKEQVRLMDKAGVGGYFMHARGGLLTEYMGEEWFDNVKAAAEEGARLGMHSWAYDENGWPSGFGGGKVNGLGLDYQQKVLHIKKDDGTPCENLVTVKDGYCYYYVVNPLYVDTLDKKVTRAFIDCTYKEYYKRCGNTIDGFFTDEPQISRDSGFPYSFILEEEFRAAYGYSIVENLDALFFEKENSERVRIDYWQLVTNLFSENFFKEIYDYCNLVGYGLTGHLVQEDHLFVAITSNGACMPHYEYFNIPGMDWLGRPVRERPTPMQVGSVAAQLGKRQVLSETFALAGHNVSHGELKRIYEWQMVHGINLLCTHLEGYSLRGIRKRDYPPAMYYQQPWWENVNLFFDAMSRIGMLLSEGEIVADTLLLHPMTSVWCAYNGAQESCVDRIDKLQENMLLDMRELEDKHVLYHFGDETLIRRHARVENGKFIIGKMSYTTVVMPRDCIALLSYTKELLEEFRAQGGRVIFATEAEANPIMPVSRLSYTMRTFPDFDLHYIVNTDDATIESEFAVGTHYLDPATGDVYPFGGKHIFTPYESLVLLDYRCEREKIVEKSATKPLSLLGEWELKSYDHNSLTLDKCDYYFDGELIERDGYVLNILPRLNELRRPVKLHQEYRFSAEYVPEEIYLVTETPRIFDIKVNGLSVDKTDCGSFRDSAFRKLDISRLVRVGVNTVTFDSVVSQTEATYTHLENSWAFESMKNCLSYDVEIEPIYIVGDFATRTVSEKEEMPLESYRVAEPPVICEMADRVDVARLDECGFAQFAGRLVLRRKVSLSDTAYHAVLRGRGMNSVSLKVNGKEVASRMWTPYQVDLTDYLTVGENELEITILNNLRNMMGPHHMEVGESILVAPGSFFKESNIFRHKPGIGESCHDTLPGWSDGYSLVHFGLVE